MLLVLTSHLLAWIQHHRQIKTWTKKKWSSGLHRPPFGINQIHLDIIFNIFKSTVHFLWIYIVLCVKPFSVKGTYLLYGTQTSACVGHVITGLEIYFRRYVDLYFKGHQVMFTTFTVSVVYIYCVFFSFKMPIL